MKTTLRKLGTAEDLVYIVKALDNRIYTVGYINHSGGACDCCSIIHDETEIELLGIYKLDNGKLEQFNLENIK